MYHILLNPTNFKLLKHNVALNGLDDRFDLRNVALSSKNNGALRFELSENFHGDHRYTFSIQRVDIVKTMKIDLVPANTLDSFLTEENLNKCVLFMDTQGFEVISWLELEN